MSFPVKCPGCETKLKAQEKHVGKKLTCPKCKHPFVVQAPEPEVVEVIADPPAEATPDPLMETDLGNLDLGDMGIGDGSLGDLGSLDGFQGQDVAVGGGSYAGIANAGPGAGNLPVSNPYAQPAKRPAAASSTKAGKEILAPK